jgi:hypothetical protein
MGDAISLLLDGEFKAAAKTGADAILQLATGVTDATDKLVEAGEELSDFVDESVKAGLEIDALLKKIERTELDLILPLARMRLEFQKFREIANDQTATDLERIEALNEAEKIQRLITKNEQDLLNLRIEVLTKQQALNDTTREEEKELLKLKEEKLISEAAAQKKINGLVSLRTGIELRLFAGLKKEADELNKILKERDEAFKNEKLESERELVGKIAEINNEAIDEADKAYAESLERRRAENIAFARSITTETGAEIEKQTKEKQESLKQEQTDIEKSISVQEGLAEKGLDNTLAFEKEALAKNQLEQLEAEKKAADLKEAIRLGELFLTLKEAEAKEDVQGSTGRALVGVAQAKAITAGIKATVQAFEKGGLVEGDEQLIRINEKGQEFVIDAPTTAALGLGKSGSNMGDFNNMLSMHEMNKSDRVVQDSDGNLKVIEAVHNLNNTLKNKPEHFIDLDKFGNIISEIKKGGITNRVIRKTNRQN